jgi:DNA-binding transcriptional LysR family regulator
MKAELGLSTLPLNSLRVFDAAARAETFKGAAQLLSVTPAAISHQIKLLELRLGVTLFERKNRSMRLTAIGERLAQVTRGAFANLENALAELMHDGLVSGTYTLTVESAPSFAAKWLVPRLSRFHSMYPLIQVRLRADEALNDLARDRSIDVAVRYGAGPYAPSLRAQQVWKNSEIIAICAPTMANNGVLRVPEDVLRYSLIRTAPPSISAASTALHAKACDWRQWLAAAQVTTKHATRIASLGPLFGSTQLAVEAAVAGQGMALAPAILVQADLRSGRLVQPFAIALRDPFCFWLLCLKDRAEEPRIRAFTEWLVAEAAISSAQ